MRFDDEILKRRGIEFSSVVPFEKCEIINERRLGALEKSFTPRSVIVFLVPYYCGEEKRNISKYAVSRDYHLFMLGLFDTICPALSGKYGGNFCGMADSAPINEVKAAAYAGLGMLGDNGMLINEKYGAYVFIGAVYTDVLFDDEGDKTKDCNHCGKCRAACPMKNGRDCLSAVTQKKGALSDEEKEYVLEYGSAWGCDICADVCPFSKKAVKNGAKTPIEFFYKDRTPYLTLDLINGMTEEELKNRAYAWRGKAVIERNLIMLYERDKKSLKNKNELPAADITVGGEAYGFKNGLFGVNAEVTRTGFFGGLSAQMLNNRKFFAGGDLPAGWECENAEFINNKNDSPCKSRYVRLSGGSIKQTSSVIALREGGKYEAKALVRAVGGAKLTFGVRGREQTFEINDGGEKYKELSFTFTGAETDNGAFSLSVEGIADVFAVSLMPADNFYGMRRDVVEALRYIAPTSLRFPGGCCADHFDWKECLKAPDLRAPFDGSEKGFMLRDTYHQECADISFNEFIMLCREIGAVPEFTVSVILSDGEDARRLVEYCNGSPDTEYGAKRAALGFTEPFNVKYFYVGNEIYYFGYEYQRDGVKAAKRTNGIVNAMRSADPDICVVVGVVADNGLRKWSEDYVRSLDCKYDAVSYHRYCGAKPEAPDAESVSRDGVEGIFADGFDAGLDYIQNGLFKDADMPVNVDEWNFSWGCDANSVMYLCNALEFHFLAKSAEKYGVTDARYFMPVNEGMITVRGKECRVECTGEVFRLLHGHKDGTVVSCGTDNKDLDVLCTRHGEELFMSVINRRSGEYKIKVNGYKVKECTQITLDGYSWNDSGFEIKRYDIPAVTGHGMAFLKLVKLPAAD